MRLKEKTSIITGASSGIGRETALLFSREGARVVAVDINQEGGQETVDAIKKVSHVIIGAIHRLGTGIKVLRQ